jgi:hypothetical protein
MKLILATLAVLALAASSAMAGSTCQRIGNFTYCSVDGGPSITCQRIGNFSYCN